MAHVFDEVEHPVRPRRVRAVRVDSLALEVDRLREKKGLAAPFVDVDLRHWLPTGASDVGRPHDGDATQAGASSGAKPRLMNWTEWHLAFDHPPIQLYSYDHPPKPTAGSMRLRVRWNPAAGRAGAGLVPGVEARASSACGAAFASHAAPVEDAAVAHDRPRPKSLHGARFGEFLRRWAAGSRSDAGRRELRFLRRWATDVALVPTP